MTADRYMEDYGFSVDNDEILITNGGTHAMYTVMEGILDPGDEVIAIAPYYLDYKAQIELPGGKMVVYNTRGEDGFDVTFGIVLGVGGASNRTKAIVVNSPSNPGGKVYSGESVQGIMDLAEKHDFLIIADDIYTALNYTDNRKPICTYEENPNRIITIYSYSKDFSMPGIRLGHIIANGDFIDCFTAINESVTFTINSLSQRLGIFAMKRRDTKGIA